MSDKEKVAFYQYFIFKGDRLKEEAENAMHYLQKNKFIFDYDVISAWKAILKLKFFEEIMDDLSDLIDD